MEIVRNGITIQLTPEEVRKAYDQYYHECLVLDAKQNFKEWLENLGYYLLDDNRFEKRYGFTIAAAFNPVGSHYVIEKFVDAFQNKFDTGEAELTIWRSAITEVMDALPHPAGDTRPYRVTYKEVLYYHYDVEAHSEEEAEEIWRRENGAGNPKFGITDPSVIEFADVESVRLKGEEK